MKGEPTTAAGARAPVQADHSRKGHAAGTVPWNVHEQAWQQYAALGHGRQSVERIAERGGFGYDEIACLLAGGDPWNHRPHTHRPVPGWERR
jgi:hypothetical protein